MWGSTRSTTSPSSSSTRRRTPCAAGCCGPKLMLKLRTLCSVMAMGSLFQVVSEQQAFGPPHASNLLLRLFVARQHIFRAFPRGQEIEIAEFLLQFDRFVNDA